MRIICDGECCACVRWLLSEAYPLNILPLLSAYARALSSIIYTNYVLLSVYETLGLLHMLPVSQNNRHPDALIYHISRAYSVKIHI